MVSMRSTSNIGSIQFKCLFLRPSCKAITRVNAYVSPEMFHKGNTWRSLMVPIAVLAEAVTRTQGWVHDERAALAARRGERDPAEDHTGVGQSDSEVLEAGIGSPRFIE